MNYRGSHKTQRPKHMILLPDDANNKADAEKFIGKKATWTTKSGNKITGIITGVHGCKGAVQIRFDEKGLPGQSLGTKIEIE